MSHDHNPGRTSRGESPLLAHLLATDLDLEEAFERLFGHGLSGPEPQAMKVVIPGEQLDSDAGSLANLFTSVLAEFEEIDDVLQSLQEGDLDLPFDFEDSAVTQRLTEDAVAFVSRRELENPLALERALAPLEDERHRFEVLFAKAQHGLDRLDVYRLSRLPPEELIRRMRCQENVTMLQNLVGFLRTLSRAADSFEALRLPEPHIRDYLRHLYLMRDWQEMARLVRLLEAAVEAQSMEVQSMEVQSTP